MKPTLFLFLIVLGLNAFSQQTIDIVASKDNTIADGTPDNSNGAGSHFFTGQTNNGKLFRALVQFDLSTVPENATITQATVTLRVSKTGTGAGDVSLHKLLSDWGESSSDAQNNEGSLAPAATGDATWNERFFGSADWTTAGGDFEAVASVTTSVAGVGSYNWTSETLLDDVLSWVDDSSSNFGWIVIGQEGSGASSKRFDSKESSSASNRPVLTLTYTVPNEPPTISDAIFAIDENSAIDTSVGTVTASDPNEDELTYEITGGNTGAAFSISTMGEILVATASALDFETTPSFSLTVSVSDGNGGSDDATITINLNDVDETVNTPPTVLDATFAIDENSAADTSIGTVTASDPDGDELTFEITSGNTGAAFSISTTGEILVATASALDFETTSSFSLTVSVSDGNGGSDEATITINLNDVDETNTPPTISDAIFAIDENSAADTSIGTVMASDPDGDELTFEITSGNTGAAFSISTTGEILVATASALDFETTPSFSLTVSVSDGNGGSDDATITINLNDVDETNTPPTISDATFAIDENSAADTSIGTVTASDPDGDELTFEITSGNTGDAFSMSATGEILVANPSALDFETTPSFSLTVSVSDGNGGSDDATITINLNDVDETVNTPPTISDATFSVDENSAIDTSVGIVTASDPDGDELTLEITAGNTGDAFSISATGEIFVATTSSLDFETTPSFSLTVSVSDGNGGSDEATITINLNDLDENPVILASPLSQFELHIYPNPSFGNVFISLDPVDKEGVTVDIFTLSGIMVKSVYLEANQGESMQKIGITDLNSGLYFVRAKGRGMYWNEKLIVR